MKVRINISNYIFLTIPLQVSLDHVLSSYYMSSAETLIVLQLQAFEVRQPLQKDIPVIRIEQPVEAEAKNPAEMNTPEVKSIGFQEVRNKDGTLILSQDDKIQYSAKGIGGERRIVTIFNSLDKQYIGYTLPNNRKYWRALVDNDGTPLKIKPAKDKLICPKAGGSNTV